MAVKKKKTTAPRKRAKSVPHTDIVAASAYASEVHAKQHPHITLQSVTKSGKPVRKSKKQLFSFPIALSQVRDRVYSKAQPVKSTHLATAKMTKKHAAPRRVAPSPYILDLKHRRTVVHHFSKSAPVSHRQQVKRAEEKMHKQGVLSLFEDQGTQGMPLSAKIAGIFSSLRPAKHINLIPQPKESLARRLRRARYGAAWQLRSGINMFAGAFNRRRYRKMQGSLKLTALAPAKAAMPLSAVTRAGAPIAAKRVSHMFSRRQEMNQPDDATSLSKLSDVRLPTLRPRVGVSGAWLRASLSFATVSLVLVGGFGLLSAFRDVRDYRMEVLGATNNAIDELNSARNQAGRLDFIEAASQFEQAGQSFQAASAVMKNQAPVLARVAAVVPGVNGPLHAATSLLSTGRDLSQAATLVSQGVSVFSDSDHFLKDQPLSYKIEYLFVRLAEATPLVRAGATELSTVDVADLPEDAAEQVASLKQTLPLLSEQLGTISHMSQPLLSLLGHENMQRYLVMFQNNTELRATGGFMGSFALVDIDRGEIVNIEIPGGGPYDMQGSLLEYYQAPRALRLINPRWEFQDSNWFFDWPTSAQTVSSFYEKAGGPSVDGVIAVDTHVMEALLSFLGPVKLPAYGAEIDAENFRQLLQEQVEVNYDRTENKPKKIIGDLAPVLLERMKDLPVNQSLELAAVLSKLLDERSIQVYHNNEDVALMLAQLGWDGRIAETPGDYLAVVHTNLAGGKTDGVIKDSYDLRVHVAEDGEVTNTLTVRREHTGVKGASFSGVRNVDYLRVYVPAGSTLLSASGFEIPSAGLFEQPDPTWKTDARLAAGDATYAVDPDSGTETYQESGKTVFANWVQVEPGQTAEVKLIYRNASGIKSYPLPAREASWTDWFSGQTARPRQSVRMYSLYWQKQAGVWSPETAVSVDYPHQWQMRSVDASAQGQSGPGVWHAEQTQDRDAWWNLLMY